MGNQGSVSILKNMETRIGMRALKWRRLLWKSEVRGDEDRLDLLTMLAGAIYMEMSAGE